MPIVVTCPNCPTKLSAPDTAAGKQVRCPKCGSTADVPAYVVEEQPIVEAKVTAPPPASKPKAAAPETHFTCCIACNSMITVIGKLEDGLIHCPTCGFANRPFGPHGDSEEDGEDDTPRKKSRRDQDDADDRPKKRASRDDDEDERPRKKKKKRDADDDDHDRVRRKRRTNKGSGGAMLAMSIGGGLTLLVVVVVVIWLVAGKGGLAKKAPPPKGWEEYSNREAGLKAYVPKKPSEVNMPIRGFGLEGGRGRGGFQGGFGGGDEMMDAESISIITSGTPGDAVRTEIYVIRFRGRVPAAMRDKIHKNPDLPIGGGQTRTVRWLGNDAMEVTSREGAARAVCADRAVVVAAVYGRNNTRASKDEEAGFFDNIELTK